MKIEKIKTKMDAVQNEPFIFGMTMPEIIEWMEEHEGIKLYDYQKAAIVLLMFGKQPILPRGTGNTLVRRLVSSFFGHKLINLTTENLRSYTEEEKFPIPYKAIKDEASELIGGNITRIAKIEDYEALKRDYLLDDETISYLTKCNDTYTLLQRDGIRRILGIKK